MFSKEDAGPSRFSLENVSQTLCSVLSPKSPVQASNTCINSYGNFFSVDNAIMHYASSTNYEVIFPATYAVSSVSVQGEI